MNHSLATCSLGSPLVLMFGNVTFKNAKGDDINVAETVVENGYANVSRHRTDEERSCIYDRLLLAEERAKNERVNIHGNKEPPVYRVNDLTLPNSSKRAKEHVAFLERNGKMRGVVEFVMSGHRFKILIPKEHILIAFALAGVKAPLRSQPAREGQKELKV